MEISERNLELARRLLPSPIVKAQGVVSNMVFHGACGKEAFWRTIAACLFMVDCIPSDAVTTFETCYLLMLKFRSEDFKEVMKTVDPADDRGMAKPGIWFADGWNHEAELVGLPTIDSSM